MKNQKKKQNNFFDIKMSADGKSGDVFIYGEIDKYAWEEEGEHSAVSFKNALDELEDVSQINLYVNSPGGSVFEGISIYNMLKRHDAKVTAHVDALAASIASVIVMAADEIYMPSNSMLMIHNPWTLAIGNSAELRKQADDLDRIGQSSMQSYLDKAGDKLDEKTLQEMLDAETWLSAEEAYRHGLCDVVEEANEMVASIDATQLKNFKNVPESLKKVQNTSVSTDEKTERERIAKRAKLDLEITKQIMGGI